MQIEQGKIKHRVPREYRDGLHSDLTDQIIGAAVEVHRALDQDCWSPSMKVVWHMNSLYEASLPRSKNAS